MSKIAIINTRNMANLPFKYITDKDGNKVSPNSHKCYTRL